MGKSFVCFGIAAIFLLGDRLTGLLYYQGYVLG
jgi:hypothetical protein